MNCLPEIFCFMYFLLARWESGLELLWLFPCSCFPSGKGSTGLQLNYQCILLLGPRKSCGVTGDRGTRKEPDIPEPVLISSKGVFNLSMSFWQFQPLAVEKTDFIGYLGHTLYLPNITNWAEHISSFPILLFWENRVFFFHVWKSKGWYQWAPQQANTFPA